LSTAGWTRTNRDSLKPPDLFRGTSPSCTVVGDRATKTKA
jgi:hypothetical protein